MRLFFKHLMKSISKRPLQPLVLVFTMMLSVALSIMSFSLENAANTETLSMQRDKYGTADIAVTLNPDSKSRFMFTEDVRLALGERGTVAGTYDVPIFLDGKSVTKFAVAVDFYEIENVFSFEFSEYGEISSADISEVAMISRSFADERNLSLGDSFEAEILGGEKTYVVGAISERKFMASYDVMVDITGIVRLISKDSILISALGDGFRPCGTLYVDVAAGYSVRECMDILSAYPAFAENSVDNITENAEKQTNIENLRHVIDVAILLSNILTIAVTFCCFFIMAAERSEENAVFNAAGAKPGLLNLMQYAEVLIYWFFGSVIGIALSIPLVRFMISYASFEYAVAHFDFIVVLKSVLILLAACFATVAVFIASSKTKKKKKKRSMETVSVIVCTSVTVAIITALFIAPAPLVFWLAFAGVGALLMTMLVLTPFLLKLSIRYLNSRLDKRFSKTCKNKFPAFRYAVKNVCSVKVLHNFSRLVSLLFTILVFAFTIIISTDGYIGAMTEILSGEYLVMNSTESCYNKVAECESVERVDKLYVSGDSSILSASSKDAFSSDIGIKRMPVGNEAVFTSAFAASLDAEVGKTSMVEFEAGYIEVYVIDIIETAACFAIFDCENFDISYNTLLVKGKDGVSSPVLMQELSEKTALDFAATVPADSLFEARIDSINIFLKASKLLLSVIVIFAIVAMADNLGQSYRARREEFELYKSSGMSRGSIRRMKALEICISMGFGVLLGACMAVIGNLITQRGLLSVRYDMFSSLTALFKG